MRFMITIPTTEKKRKKKKINQLTNMSTWMKINFWEYSFWIRVHNIFCQLPRTYVSSWLMFVGLCKMIRKIFLKQGKKLKPFGFKSSTLFYFPLNSVLKQLQNPLTFTSQISFFYCFSSLAHYPLSILYISILLL